MAESEWNLSSLLKHGVGSFIGHVLFQAALTVVGLVSAGAIIAWIVSGFVSLSDSFGSVIRAIANALSYEYRIAAWLLALVLFIALLALYMWVRRFRGLARVGTVTAEFAPTANALPEPARVMLGETEREVMLAFAFAD